MKYLFSDLTYEGLDTIMHGVMRHTKNIVANNKIFYDRLNLDEVCYWEILNALQIRLKNESTFFGDFKGLRDWKTEAINDYMREYRDILLPDFENTLMGSKKPHTLNLSKLSLPNIDYLDNNTLIPFLINHFAGLYGYEVKREPVGEFVKSDLDALRNNANKSKLVLVPRSDGKIIDENEIYQSMLNKIATAKKESGSEPGEQ